MKASEISVGSVYVGKVSGNLTRVRVDMIDKIYRFGREKTVYRVTNLATGRQTTYMSAAKFRSVAAAK